MAFITKSTAGVLLVVGGMQFIILLMVSATQYPGYDIAADHISKLGVWGSPSAYIFNTSIILLGVSVTAAGGFLHGVIERNILPICMILSGVGSVAVGIFPEDFPFLHAIGAVAAFIFSNAAAITSRRHLQGPLSPLGLLVGFLGIISLVLFLTGNDLGIGPGGMERMVVYPSLIWMVALGGYLAGDGPLIDTNGRKVIHKD